jgi:hypothetical protein
MPCALAFTGAPPRSSTDAKDTDEEKAAATLAQFGPWVPAIAFEEVYQEIIAAYCGNYWGRSNAHATLSPFIDTLNTTQVRRVARMFAENERVQKELSQSKPKARAVTLLTELRGKLTISSHNDEVDDAVDAVSLLRRPAIIR